MLGLSLFASCVFTYDPPDKGFFSLKISNTTKQTIYVKVTAEDKLQPEQGISLYQLFEKEVAGMPRIDTLFEARILPGDTSIVYFDEDTSAQLLVDSLIDINVFYFDVALLEKHDWKTIAKHQYYTQKRRYTLQELAALNWVITFP